LLQKVLVSFGDQIGFSDTLKGALDQVFGGDSGQTSSGVVAGDGSTKTTTAGQNLADALQRAKQALADAQAALAKGNFAAYGKAQDALKQAINDAVRAQGQSK
jgi:uncharacterized membrane protein (UPF0182 family)